MPGNRETQKLQTKQRIKVVSKKLIIKNGIHNTTIREISKEAQVATGTVLSHYLSKNDLFYDIFYTDIDDFALAALSGIDHYKTLEEKLVHICNSFLTSYGSEPKLYTDFLEISMFAKGEWGDRFTKQVEEFGIKIAELYMEGIRKGEIRKGVDIQAAVGTFFSLYFMAIIQQIKLGFVEKKSTLDQLKATIKLHLKGIKNEED